MVFFKTWWQCIVPAALLLSACGNNPKEIPAYTQDFCSAIHSSDTGRLSSELAVVADSMERHTGVYVLEDGGNSMVARAYLCENAEQTLDIQYFIFSTDNVGLIACDYIVRAADRGVKVRLLIDDILVDAGPHEILTLNSHKNIEIKIYNPGVNLGKNIAGKIKKLATDFRGANQRMHNKTFTVDGKVVITGGRNIADEYFDYDHEYNFRDRDILLFGQAAKQVQQSFNTFWNSALSIPVTELVEEPGNNFDAPDRFERLHQYACNPANFWPQVRERIKQMPDVFTQLRKSGALVWTDSVEFVSDIPGKNTANGMHDGGNTTYALTALVQRAQASIDIQSPYLIVTDEGLKLFADAVKRGVKVRILTNSLSSTDNLPAFAGYQKIRRKLLQAGVRIFEFRPDARERFNIMTGALQEKMNYTPIFGLHAKSMVIDGHITVVGTYNLDPRSANLNSECVTIVNNTTIAASVLKGMEEEYLPDNAWETTLDWNPDKEVSRGKRAATWVRRALPAKIL